MATVVWEVVQTRRCERLGRLVRLEVQHVYPVDLLPDPPPLVRGRRCSEAVACNQREGPTCVWAGTLPGYDPLA